MANIAFLGLGTMGYPMAGHLVKAGHKVTAWNRTTSVIDKWQAETGGISARTAAQAVENAELVAMCLGDDPDVEAVAGPLLGIMKKGAVLVDHTTTSAKLARKLANQATDRNILWLDAPVSGGEAGAQNGHLAIMCGGSLRAYSLAEPVMQAYGKTIAHLGEAGSGQLAKMVNQICIAGVVQGLAEGLQFAKASGIDVPSVVKVISKGAAQSWQMENRHKTMDDGEFSFGFAVDWMRKDLRIALAEAKECGLDLAMTRTIDNYYAEIQQMGGGRWDTSSLIVRL